MAIQWKTAKTYSDILYVKSDGIAKITINRPAKRNAFRPETITQMIDAFSDARDDQKVGVVLLTGAGPHRRQVRLLRGRGPERPRERGVCRG
jgi:naphthoate synthase